MLRKLVISTAVLAAAIATPASAQVVNDTGWYAGVGGTYYTANDDDVDVTGATGRLGYRFTPNFGVEGEASFGIDGDTADVLGTPVDVDLDDQFGVYAVGFLPVSETLELVAGREATLDRALRPAPPVLGAISLMIEDGWGEVFVNGRKVGKAPNQALRLPVGRHRLLIRNPPSGREVSLDVTVDASKVLFYKTRLPG